MSAYLIAQVSVTDQETFDRYRAEVPATLALYGGRYVIRGGQAHPLEGEWTVPRLVVIEFDSVEAARRWYNSPEYQKILPLRLAAAETTAAIVEGYDQA